ncbi:NAD(P)-binding protein [Suillus subalutaceus]|uniref:NAD(P)-binding protein n=1 Tax=Suillus subalutaceus TaxID=48586 RepID=UPI001B8607F8|nr:NAD(P)-binding protein [Suillus subalutaceus]KAG1865847.1 NAD(P)-binding protein [Suillus subalutaceus]
MASSNSKVWFVTGASSGFGRAVTEVMLQKGDNVVATLRKPAMLDDLANLYSKNRLLFLLKSLPAFLKAREAFGRIDVVFNNAGLCIIGEAEGMPDDDAKLLFDTLFWGAANVTKEAVTTFRDFNQPRGGRLLQMSSRGVLRIVPGVAHYAAAYSQTALESLSEGYATELDPAWNIKITVLQPARFRTAAPWTNTLVPIHPAYSDPNLPSRQYRSIYPGAERFSDGDIYKFALQMYRLVQLDDPPFYLPLHRTALEAAKIKGQKLLQAVEDYGSWSDDVYLDEENSQGRA